MPINEQAADAALGMQAQQNVAATVTVPSDQAARAISQEYSMGIPAAGGMYAPQPEESEEPTDVHPAVEAYQASDPSRAAATRDDSQHLSFLAKALGAIKNTMSYQYMPGEVKNGGPDPLGDFGHTLISAIPNWARPLQMGPNGSLRSATDEETRGFLLDTLNKALMVGGAKVGEKAPPLDLGMAHEVKPGFKTEGQTPQEQITDERNADFEPNAPRLEGPRPALPAPAEEPMHIFDEPPAPGTDPKADEQYQAHAEENEAALDDAVAAVQRTSFSSSTPQIIHEFASQVSPDAIVTVPYETVSTLFQEDPAFVSVFHDHLAGGALDYVGDGVQMSMANYLAHMTPWHELFKGDIEIGEGISVNEAKALGESGLHTPPVAAVQEEEKKPEFNPLLPLTDGESSAKDLGYYFSNTMGLYDLPPEVKSQLSLYTTTPGYQSVNDLLRKGSLAKAQEYGVDAEALHASMQKAFENASFPNDTVVYRGVQGTGHTAPKFDDLYVGMVNQDKGYMSTSLDSNIGKTFATGGYSNPGSKNGYVLRIKLPKGSKALPMHDVATLEKEKSEVLLNAGAKYKITAIDPETRIVDAELVPDEMTDEEALSHLFEPHAPGPSLVSTTPAKKQLFKDEDLTKLLVTDTAAYDALMTKAAAVWSGIFDAHGNIVSMDNLVASMNEMIQHPDSWQDEETSLGELIEKIHAKLFSAEPQASAKPAGLGDYHEYDEDLAASLGGGYGDFLHATGKEFPEPEDFETIDPADQEEIEQAKAIVAAAVNKVAKDHWLNQLFNGASTLGMSPEQYRQYSAKGQAAFEATKAKLWEQTLNRVKDKYNQEWQNAYKQQYNHALNIWMAKPIIKAEHALRYSVKDQTTNIQTKWMTDGKPTTFYHGGTHSNIGTPDNPWRLMGYPVISFSETPVFANDWIGGNSYDPYYVDSWYKQETAPTLYITHLKVQNPADYRNPEDVEKAVEWFKDHAGSSPRHSLADGGYLYWERPDMWKDVGWDGARMVEGQSHLDKIATGKFQPNACVVNPEQILFKYAIRFEEQNYKLSITNQYSYPAYYWDSLPNSFFVKEGGFDADVIADQVGYTSGMEMLDELNTFEKGRGKTPFMTYFLGLVKNEARIRTMSELYGITPANPKGLTMADVKAFQASKILEDAQAAFCEPQITDLLIDQFNAIALSNGGTPITAEEVKAQAEAKFAQLTLKRGLNLRQFERMLTTAGRKAETLLLKGKIPEALKVKQFQIITQYQLIASHNLQREFKRFEKRMDKWKKATSSTIDQEFYNRIHEVMKRLGYPVKRDPAELNEALGPQSLADWAAEKHATMGIEIVIAPIPLHLGVKDIPVGAWQAIGGDEGMLKSIAKNGRNARTVIVEGKRKELEELRAEVKAATEAGGSRLKYGDVKHTDLLHLAAHGERSFNAYMLQPERIIEDLDGDEIAGPLVMALNRPMQEGAVKANDLHKAATTKLKAFLKEQPPEWFPSLRRGVDKNWLFDGDYVIKTRAEMVRFMLNMGNEGNFEKLTRGWSIPPEEALAFIHAHATKADWDFVQHIWDQLEALKPEIESLYRDVTGLRPTWVEGWDIATPFGTYKGKYYGIDYDWVAADFLGIRVPTSVDAKNPFGKEFKSSLPSNPYSKGRTNFYAPINLDFEGVMMGLSAIIHDISYRRALIQATKILSDPSIRSSISRGLGPEFLHALENWRDYVAHKSLMDTNGQNAIAKFLRAERKNLTMLGLGLRVTTAILHGPTALFNSMGEVHQGEFAKAMRDLWTGINWNAPESNRLHKWIDDNSGEIRHRLDNVDRDIHDAIEVIVNKRGYLSQLEAVAFHLVGFSDMISAKATWLAAYRVERKAEVSHEEAAKRADQFVRRAHGSGDVVNLAGIQQGGLGPMGELGKQLTMFTSFLNHIYNRVWRTTRNAKRGSRYLHAARGGGGGNGGGEPPETGDTGPDGGPSDDPRKVAMAGARRNFSKVLSSVIFVMALPIAWKIITDKMRGKHNTPTDDMLDGVHTLFGSIPGTAQVIDVVHEAERHHFKNVKDFTHAKVELPFIKPLTLAMASIMETPQVIAWLANPSHHSVPDRWLQTYLDTATSWGKGLPGQLNGDLQVAADIFSGKAHPHTFGDWLNLAVYGPAAEKKDGKGGSGGMKMSMRLKL